VRIGIACDPRPREANGVTHSLRASAFSPKRGPVFFLDVSRKMPYSGPSPHCARTTCCDRGYARPSGRPRVFLRQAQGKLTLRRTEKYASGPRRCGCPVARPSPRSRDGVSCIMRARGTDPAPESPSTLLSPRWFSSVPPGAGRRISAPKTLDSFYPTGI
jgi:hypothetical protein